MHGTLEIKCSVSLFKRLIIECSKKLLLHSIITDYIRGYEKSWILGDEFMHKTYNQHFRDRRMDQKLYMKEHFEVMDYSKSKYDALDRNAFSRIRNLMVKAMKEQVLLPKMIIIVPDDDLASYFQASQIGVSKQLGRVTNWLLIEFE